MKEEEYRLAHLSENRWLEKIQVMNTKKITQSDVLINASSSGVGGEESFFFFF